MKFPKLKATIAGLLAVACLANAHAVSLSSVGQGQVLIYPYYTANGTYDTLFSIANGGGFGTAAKVRFREGRNSRIVLEFNLYLGQFASWTAMVTRNAAGEPVLRTQETACTVPQFQPSAIAPGATEIAFTNANYANYDRAGSGLDRAREGFFEVIGMGSIDESFLLAPGKSLIGAVTIGKASDLTGTQDCAAVAAAWQPGGVFVTTGGAGLSGQARGLYGMGTLINVLQGTDYSYDPVALVNFTYLTHHTAPGAATPTLADAAAPQSVVIQEGLTAPISARVGTWDNGIDAVSAVLTHWAVLNEYIAATPTLDAATDVVLTFPTKSFYTVRESDTGQTTRPPFSRRFDDTAPAGEGSGGGPLADGESQGACEIMHMFSYARDGRWNAISPFGGSYIPPANPSTACWSATVLSYGNVLNSANAKTVDAHRFTRDGSHVIQFLGISFVSKEGNTYQGLPVIGFTVQKYVNGNLGGVLSNYGGTLAHKYLTFISHEGLP